MKIPKIDIKNQKTITKSGGLKEGFKPEEHNYLIGAENMYKSLKEVLDGKTNYYPHHMGILANTIELYYKGIIALSIPKMSSYTKESHNLPHLYSEVTTHIMDIYPGISRYEENALYDYLKELSDLYIESRYLGAIVSKESFVESMDFLREQREFVMGLVDPTKSWKNNKDIFENEANKNLDFS